MLASGIEGCKGSLISGFIFGVDSSWLSGISIRESLGSEATGCGILSAIVPELWVRLS